MLDASLRRRKTLPRPVRLFLMIAIIPAAAGAGPAIAWAGSTCGDEADPGQPAALEPRAAERPAPAGARARGANVQLVFFEFYDRPAALFINGRLFRQGV